MYNLLNNIPFLPHNFPWKCRRISHFFTTPNQKPCLQVLWEFEQYLTVLTGELSHSWSVSLPICSCLFILLVFRVKAISFRCNVHLYPFLRMLCVSIRWGICFPLFFGHICRVVFYFWLALFLMDCYTYNICMSLGYWDYLAIV